MRKSCPKCGSDDHHHHCVDGAIMRTCDSCNHREYDSRWNTRHIPEGYALVPIEPAEKSLLAGSLAGRVSAHTAGKIFEAMIAAAQEEV